MVERDEYGPILPDPAPRMPTAADLDTLRTATPAESARTPDRVRRERISVNIKDETLPGNVGWLTGVRDAIVKTKDKIVLSAQTRGDRKDAERFAADASKGRTSESRVNERADWHTRREAYHTGELARLNARSGFWKLPVVSSITKTQKWYHSWRERKNQHQATEFDDRARRIGKWAQASEAASRRSNDRVTARVNVVSGRWQSRLDAAQSARDKIDADINEISEVIQKNEALVERVKQEISVLENSRGGDRTARRERLRTLHKSVAEEEAALQIKRKELERKEQHQARLATAQDSAGEAINMLDDYYPKPSAAAENPTDPEPALPEGALMGSLQELAEAKGNITNEQIGNAWNSIFSKKLPDGYKTLILLLRSAFPDREFDDAPNHSMPIKEFFQNMRDLYRKSSEFRKVVESVTGNKKAKGIDSLVGRFATHIAFTPNLNDL